MIRPQIPARLREQTLFVGADSLGHLLFTGREPEIGGWSAHIMNISLKIFLLRHEFCLFDQRLMASGLDNSALMEGQRTKRTAAKAAAAADQTEFHLRKCRDTACSIVHGMPGSHIRQTVDFVHFFLT